MRSILTIGLLWLCQLALLGQARIGSDPDYNPNNPADPNVPVKKYTLATKAVPDFSGSTNRSNQSRYAAGERVYINASANTGFKFVNWTRNDSVVSTSRSFYYTMPEEDVVLNANFVYSPDSPANPDSMALSYELSVEAQPKHGGSFNLEYATVQQGSNRRLYSYTNTGYRFIGWYLNDSLLSTANSFYYTMGGEDAHIIGKFEYNPSNPSNPGKNSWNETTGEVIVDDFAAGYLHDAIYSVIGNSSSDDVTMITVSGRMNSNDFGIANYYSNCTYLDLSRSYGYNAIPSYAYDYNTVLTNVILPACVESVEYRAFYQCSNLAEVVCYAVTPPTVGSNAFTGIAEGATLRVLSSSIPLYSEADVWKDFVILPLSDEVRTLEVALPEGSEDGKFKNMTLELVNVDNGQKQKYVISDRVSYTFNGLLKKSTFNVYVKNALGVVLGEINNVVIGEENVSVAFDSLLEPQTVTAKLVTPDGMDVTAQSQLLWLMENGTYIQTGAVLDGFVEGTSVILRTTLPQNLAMQYLVPADTLYTVVAGSNTPTIVLKEIPQVQLHGKVTDIATGEPLDGAVISVSQTLNGKYSKTFTAKSGRDGSFVMTVFVAPGTIAAVSTDYVSKSMELPALSDNVDVGEIALKSITGAIIDLAFSYTKSAVDGESPEVLDYYADYANVTYAIYNETQNRAITQFNVQYPKIVLLEEVAEGDKLRVTASSVKNAFTPVSSEAEVYSNNRASALFDIVQLGGIKAAFSSTDNSAVVAMLYNANGVLMKKYNYSSASITIPELQDGNYTLVTMGNSALFNSVYNLSQLAATGLKEGVDYVKNTVEVKSGAITAVNNVAVPLLDESKLYYTGDYTSFSVNKASIVAGNYLTLKGQVNFKSVYASKVGDVNLVVDLPESASFVENSVMVGSRIASYTLDGNRLTIPMGENYTDQVRFCIIPTVGGDFAPNAFAQFAIDGKEVLQPIGSANYTVKDLSIILPVRTANKSIVVKGGTFAGSEISVYDNGILIGSTYSLPNGNWVLKGELQTDYEYSYHNIHAVIKTKNGIELQTETKKVIYDTNSIEVSTVHMICGSYDFKFDFLEPQTTVVRYTWPTCGDNFTFTVDFTRNDTTRVSNVKLNVLTSNGEVRVLDTFYNTAKDCWNGVGHFPSSYCLPINVDVDFELIDTEFSDSLRFQEQCENLFSSYLKYTNDIDSIMNFELVEDEENYTVLRAFSEQPNESYLLRLEILDETSLLIDSSFICIEDEKGNYYQKMLVLDTRVEVIVADYSENMFYKLVTDFDGGSGSSSASSRAKKNKWVNLKKFEKGLGEFAELAESMVPFLDYFEGCGDYKFWVDYLSEKDDELVDKSIKVSDALFAKCPDGTNKVPQNLLSEYYQMLQNANTNHSLFSDAAYSMLDAWRMTLINSFLVEGLTLNLGKAIKALPKAGKILRNSKNAKYFQYIIRDKKTRDYLSKIVETTYDATQEKLEDILDTPDFMDYESMSKEFSSWAPKRVSELHKLYNKLLKDIKNSYKKCSTPEPPPTPEDRDYPLPDFNPYIDPAGYVYEAVSSNRLQGVTATCYYKEMVEDMYGDLHENIVLWNAAEYAQENPLFTDENGMYRWDVPQGLWQVKFEKEGYQTTYSEWLPVPPPQLEVNVGMVQNRQPEVESARAYEDGIEVEFDKYMQPDLLTVENIFVTKNGDVVSGSVKLLDSEQAYENNSAVYASKVRFVPDTSFLTTDKVQLTVSRRVKSYAGVQMEGDYTQEFDIEKEVKSIVVDSLVQVNYGSEHELLVSALPYDAAIGKMLLVQSTSSMIVSVDADTLFFDENGQAKVVLAGELPGASVVTFSLADAELSATTMVEVGDFEPETTAAPVASRVSGTELYRNTTVALECETEGAVIYYTLDGSCPCDETSRLLYEAPIAITSDSTLLKAVAIAPNMYESEIVEYLYILKKSTVAVNLHKGWSWVSHNIEDGIDTSVFKDVVKSVISQNGEFVKDSLDGTFGELAILNPVKTYKMNSVIDETLQFSGVASNPGDTIALISGWNWLGYPVNQIMSLNEAFANTYPDDMDYIVGQDGFAQFVNGKWVGTLSVLTPGVGYLYNSISDKDLCFNTSIVSKASSLYFNDATATSPWTVDKYSYPNVMCLVAEIYNDGDKQHPEGYYVGAFAGDECRGVGQVVDDMLMMNIYGAGDETIDFIVVDKENAATYSVDETISFTEGLLGSMNSPYRFNFGDAYTGVGNVVSGAISVRVENGSMFICSSSPLNSLSLSDAYGNIVIQRDNVRNSEAIGVADLSTGVYIVSVKSENTVLHKKVMVVNNR